MTSLRIMRWKNDSSLLAVEIESDDNQEIIICNSHTHESNVHEREIVNRNNTSQLVICAFIIEYLVYSKHAICTRH